MGWWQQSDDVLIDLFTVRCLNENYKNCLTLVKAVVAVGEEGFTFREAQGGRKQ